MRRGAPRIAVRAGLLALLAAIAAISAPAGAYADNPIGLLYQSSGISPPGAKRAR